MMTPDQLAKLSEYINELAPNHDFVCFMCANNDNKMMVVSNLSPPEQMGMADAFISGMQKAIAKIQKTTKH